MEQTQKGTTPIETLVARAQEGDRAALETVIASMRDRIYNLALRMLWHPADAEDATQEILVRLVTHLGSFRGESTFSTWAYRVASNYLLTTRKRRAEREELTFERVCRTARRRAGAGRTRSRGGSREPVAGRRGQAGLLAGHASLPRP